MTLKTTLIATRIWMGVIVAIGVVAIVYLVSQDLPEDQLQERTEMFGSGVAILACIGLACIWLPFAARMGAEQRAKRKKAARRKKR